MFECQTRLVRLMTKSNKDRALVRILKSFDGLSKDYQEKIKGIAEYVGISSEQVYFTLLRRIFEKLEEIHRSNSEPGSTDLDMQQFSPATYFDPLVLWKAVRPFASDQKAFMRLQKNELKKGIESYYAEELLNRVDDKHLELLMDFTAQTGANVDPRVFKEQGKIIAPVKYLDEHFQEVDDLIKNGWRIEASLDEVFNRHFSESKGDSREGFGKQYRRRHANLIIKGKDLPA